MSGYSCTFLDYDLFSIGMMSHYTPRDDFNALRILRGGTLSFLDL